MKYRNKLQLLSVAAGASLVALIFIGCRSSTVSRSDQDRSASPTLLSADAAKTDAPPARGRAQIWAETCNRCHNTRSPDSYSGKEWAIVMTHMRVRGYLTGEDQRAILEFLQSQ